MTSGHHPKCVCINCESGRRFRALSHAATTKRVSSNTPNPQNIPTTRTKVGDEISNAFLGRKK